MPQACKQFKPKVLKQRDNRPSAAARGYTSKWQRERLIFLAQNPVCVQCLREGKTVIATVVDHIQPHKGDYRLMWDSSNWQALCKMHHDKKTGKENLRKGK